MPKKKNQDATPSDQVIKLFLRLTTDRKRHFQADLMRELCCSDSAIKRMVEVVERHLGKDSRIETGREGRRRYYEVVSDIPYGLAPTQELEFLALYRDIASAYLPPALAQRLDQSLNTLALHPPGSFIGFHGKGIIDYSRHEATIASLRDAIKARRICQIHYSPAGGGGETRTYRYAPGRILAMSGTLYVQGYRLPEGSLLQDRPTTFSIHRIRQIAPTGEHFNFNAADAPARAFGLNWHEPKRVQIHIAPQAADYVRDRVWSDDQTIEDKPDGSITLTVTTTSEKELNAWVWSFGGLARVMSSMGASNY